jgi:sugar/nucleoside kinase (ribokinase family)
MYNLNMYNLQPVEPVDYLVIGHMARDITTSGFRLGGTAAYSALTAKALGMRTGIITAWAGEFPYEELPGIRVISLPAENCTTFENVYTVEGRIQYLHHHAARIDLESIPENWRRSSIIHIGPIAQEVNPILGESFSPNLIALTPQGWLRKWDEIGRVSACNWDGAEVALRAAGAAVISIEDVSGDEDEIERMALACPVLAVTEGPAGARLYWHNDLRKFRAPVKKEVDATGAGDIFAAAFFVRLLVTRDPWEAARFATQLAATSVTREGLDSIPRQEEIKTSLVEVF